MKMVNLISGVVLAFVATISSADEQPVATCQLSGKDLAQFRLHSSWAFPQKAEVAEFVLAEYLLEEHQSELTEKTRLKLQKFYYEIENGKLVRKGMSGAPYSLVGYAQMGEVMTFNYNGEAGLPNITVMTNGKKSIIGYSQGSFSSRSYQHSIECEIHNMPSVDVPQIDVTKLDAEEYVKILENLSYRNGRNIKNLKDTIPADKLANLYKSVKDHIEDYEFTKNDKRVHSIEWKSSKKCSRVKHSSKYYDSARVIYDFEGNVLGYVMGSLKCTGSVTVTKRYYNRETGEPEDETHTETASVDDIYLDADFNPLTEIDSLSVNLSRNW